VGVIGEISGACAQVAYVERRQMIREAEQRRLRRVV
jgi:hypothetical protein